MGLRQHEMTVGSEVAGDNEERRKRRKWLPGDLKSGLAISLLPLLLTAVSGAHKTSIRFCLCLRHAVLPVEPSTLSAPFHLMAVPSPLLPSLSLLFILRSCGIVRTLSLGSKHIAKF